MKYIQYVVVFRLKRKDLPKRGESRKELVEKAKKISQTLGEKICQEFPEVKLVRTGLFGPILNIPKRNHAKTADKIRVMFDCEIARSDTLPGLI